MLWNSKAKAYSIIVAWIAFIIFPVTVGAQEQIPHQLVDELKTMLSTIIVKSKNKGVRRSAERAVEKLDLLQRAIASHRGDSKAKFAEEEAREDWKQAERERLRQGGLQQDEAGKVYAEELTREQFLERRAEEEAREDERRYEARHASPPPLGNSLNDLIDREVLARETELGRPLTRQELEEIRVAITDINEFLECMKHAPDLSYCSTNR